VKITNVRTIGTMTGKAGATGASRPRMVALAALATMTSLSILSPRPALSHDPPGFDFGGESPPTRNLQLYLNDTGAVATYNVNGRTDPRNAFFAALGTNGRSCATCHVASQGMTISPPQIRQRFQRTNGRDPLFAAVDGANCANARRNDRSAHSLLLEHGLIRIAQAVPANAQFTISVVHDPYGCALVADPQTGGLTASVYRRPLPTSNVSFLSTVMWDARETLVPLNNGATFLDNLKSNLTHQAVSAVTSHGESTVRPSDRQLAEIVDFELGLFTAQTWDFAAGRLDAYGALGGPKNLSNQIYYPGINDSLGAEPTGAAFTSAGMSSFGPWAKAGANFDDDELPADLRALGLRWLSRYLRDRATARRDVEAGEELFNTAPLTITAVRGLNDNATLAKPAAIKGTCTTCHDAPNVGHHSLPLPLDIGVGHTPISGLETDATIAAGIAELNEPDLPVFEISGCPTPFNNGEPVSLYTTDPGKGLISGQCADVNRLKGPVLRGLAARAPYFHNGSAATLLQAVSFYNQRFQMNLTEQQKAQLVAFLNSL
jgi:cytochrome c peroxidase